MIKRWIKALSDPKENTIDLEQVHGTVRLKYQSYDSYLTHQGEKLEKNFGQISQSDRDYSQLVYERYKDHPAVGNGKTCLCLGARLGGEVRGFLRAGSLAIGVDINPGPKNNFVLFGDVHNLVFPHASFDVVFTNIIDHIFDLKQFVAEIHRVLKPGGFFITELAAAKPRPGSYEVLDTTNQDSIISIISNHLILESDKEVINKTDYINWSGRNLFFKK